MMADPDVTRYLADGRPLSRGDAWRQLAMIIGHWELRGFGLWAVEERSSGAFLGRIGCFEPEGWPGFEIGYSARAPRVGTRDTQARLRRRRCTTRAPCSVEQT